LAGILPAPIELKEAVRGVGAPVRFLALAWAQGKPRRGAEDQ